MDPREFLIVYASGRQAETNSNELHANFRLNRDGGSIALVRPDGITVESSLSYPALADDTTVGLPMSDFRVGATVVEPPQASTLVTVQDIEVLRVQEVPGEVNNSPDVDLAIDGDTTTTTSLTPSFTRGDRIVAVDVGEMTTVSRLRVSKIGDGDQSSAGAPGLAPIDNMDLQILFTRDSGPLHRRGYLPVPELTNGYFGTELILADAVNSADATVDNDHHDFANDGWYSLSFAPLQATGLAIRFGRDRGDSAPWNQYRTHEIEVREGANDPLPLTDIAVFRPSQQTLSPNNPGDQNNAIDGDDVTWTLLTPDNSQGPQLATLDFGTTRDVNRLRVNKLGNTDQSSAGAPGLAPLDNMDLQILFTTDTGSPAERRYSPVRGLTSGFLGWEPINADAIDPLSATVDNDHHDTVTDGWYSLSFETVAASGLAIRFDRDSLDTSSDVHYLVQEIEVHTPVELDPTEIVTTLGIDQFPGPDGTERDRGDAELARDGDLTTAALLTTPGTDRTHGRQRVAVDVGNVPVNVNRLRVFKAGDADTDGELDAFDLKVLWTRDTGPLSQRNFVPVTQLINGYNGVERIEAGFVDFDSATVLGDQHDSPGDGFYSLTFDAVETTAIALEFLPSDFEPTGINHYAIQSR